jgi:hypothetical protein
VKLAFGFLKPYFVLIAVILCALALLPAILDRPIFKVSFSGDGWAPDNFVQLEATPADLPPTLRSTSRFWQNFTAERGASVGRLESPAFVLERADLFVPVVGYPNSQYADVYLESQIDKRRFWINAGAAHEQWRSAAITVPQGFVNTPLRLIAHSNLTGVYLGVGTPYYRLNPALPWFQFSRTFSSALLSSCYLLLLFFPAFYLLRRYARLTTVESSLPAFVLTALAALALFYVCYFSPSLARAFVRLWLVAALVLAIVMMRRNWSRGWWTGHRFILVAILLTIFQACFVFSFATVSSFYAANDLFYPATWSTDNQIPIIVTQAMARGAPVGELVDFTPWKVSDRTPLLSCLLFPAATILRHFPHQVGASAQGIFLQMCSFGIQNSWILPVWVLLRRLRLREEKCIVALVLIAATPFVFFNTVYVWPKLLAATFCMIQFVFLSNGVRRFARPFFPIALSGAAAGLAVMAHGSAAIAVLAIYIAAVFRHPRPQWLGLTLSGAVALLVVAPWLVWTKVAAPTINPLPRYLLTGDFGFSQPTPRGVLESALNMYQKMPLSTWLHTKLIAAKTLLGLDLSIPPMALGRDPFLGFESIRAYQFFFLAPSLGLLLIPLFWFVWIRRNKQALPLPKRLVLRDLALATTLTLLLQFTIMMAPHLLHHYPYFLPLSLHVLAIIIITMRDRKILRALACINYLLFVLFWIILILARAPVLSMGGLVCALILLALASVVVGRWAFRQPRAAGELVCDGKHQIR